MRTCSSKARSRATQRVPDANPRRRRHTGARKEAVASSSSLGPDAPFPRRHLGFAPCVAHGRGPPLPCPGVPFTRPLHPCEATVLRYRVFVDPEVRTRPTGSMPMPCRPNHREAKPTNRRRRADHHRASDEQWVGPLSFYRLVQIPEQSFRSLPRSYGAGYSGVTIRGLEYILRGYRQKEMFSYGRI